MVCINKKLFFLVLLLSILFIVSLAAAKNLSYKSSAITRTYPSRFTSTGKISPTPVACSIDQSYNQGSYYFHRGDKNFGEVAITFDDCFFPQTIPNDPGYKRHVTIADIKKEAERLEIPLTFFCVGVYLETDQDFFNDLIKSDKFELQNHTYSHKDLNTLSRSEINHQIEAWIDAYNNLTSSKTKKTPLYLRPPGMSGVDNQKVIDAAKKLSIAGLAGGSIVSKVSVNATLKAEDVVSCVKESLSPEGGDIIILHPLKSDVKALDGIVNAIKEKGLKLTTLSELPGIPK